MERNSKPHRTITDCVGHQLFADVLFAFLNRADTVATVTEDSHPEPCLNHVAYLCAGRQTGIVERDWFNSPVRVDLNEDTGDVSMTYEVKRHSTLRQFADDLRIGDRIVGQNLGESITLFHVSPPQSVTATHAPDGNDRSDGQSSPLVASDESNLCFAHASSHRQPNGSRQGS